jgi:serine/threonine protein kinase/Tol biopolymer transport system component
MPLSAGSRVGPYEIVGALGAGGMGEVYRARDTKLDRDVAIKILPELFANDPERLARFQREAKTLASLNHPNIAQIHGIEDSGYTRALVMEIVEGEDLAARLTRGRLSTADTLLIAKQVAEALDAAHERGIVHRDLKPANIRVTDDGTVKVLDFGLAKAMDAGGQSAADAMNSPTFASPRTELGVILGTAAYMAPEQATGKAVDKRADIWAFGCVLYELLTGRSPFASDSAAESIGMVVTRDPDWSALPSSLPPTVRQLIRRCLTKDPKQRLRDIGEARIALSQPLVEPTTEPPDAATPRSQRTRVRRAVAWTAAVFALAMIGAAATWSSSRGTRPDAPILSLGIDAGGDTALAGVGWAGLHWVGPTAVLSPDGRLLVFIARGPSGGRWQLYTRRLDALKATALAGTEDAFAPFFSPDGRSIAFFSTGRLMKVALNGGAVTTICPAEEGRGGAWAEDGTILFAPRPDGPLFRVSSDGGTPTQATTLDTASKEATHRWPQVLPGGRAFLFTVHSGPSASDAGTIVGQWTSDGKRTILHRGGLYGRYAPSGHLLYVHQGSLFAAQFDVERLQVTGTPVAVVGEVEHALTNGSAQFSFSNTGLLAYRRARSANRLLQWMDVAGQVQPMRNVSAEYQEARFSDDGTRLLLVVSDGAQSDVWVYDIPRDTMLRLTFHPDNDWSPSWSPDGSYVVYGSWRADVGTFNLFMHRADGTGQPERLTSSRNSQMPVAWHPSGQYLLYSERRPETGEDLMLLRMERTPTGEWKPGATRALLGSASSELNGKFSPDGKWLAYTSDESGRTEVYVQPFPGPGGRWQVSAEGAEWIEWKENGQLFYGRSEEVVMIVPHHVEGSTFVAEKPRMWMRIPPGVTWVDPALDGTRAVVIRSEDPRRESMVVLVNFFEHLRRAAGLTGQ